MLFIYLHESVRRAHCKAERHDLIQNSFGNLAFARRTRVDGLPGLRNDIDLVRIGLEAQAVAYQVSAAKPINKRSPLRSPTSARMSGVGSSSRESRVAVFFSFCLGTSET